MIHIVCSVDENYLRHCTVMLVSLFENNNNINFHIHIIFDSLDEKGKNILNKTISKYKHIHSFYKVNDNLLINAPLSHHVSISTYYRILIPDLICPSIEKVLYLDCDIIIRNNIQDLWDCNITNYQIGAAKEFISQEHKNTLGIPNNYFYFNAGVILINLKKWRSDSTSQKLIHYINQNANKIIYWDQDALNAVLYDKCYIFPSIWNVTEGFFKTEYNPLDYGISLSEKKFCCSNPNIIHFTGTEKPWFYHNRHPYKKEYLAYQKKTIFKKSKQIGEQTLLDKLIRKFKEFLLKYT